MYKIKQWNVFFCFSFNIGNGQRLLLVTDIATQVTGTNRLVMGFSLMPVTFAVIGDGQSHNTKNWYRKESDLWA
jgi:hypothetical protein